MQNPSAPPSISVDLWSICLAFERPYTVSEAESARAARFLREADRVRWMRAHSALRAILARYTALSPLDLRFQIGQHGKPALDHPSAPHFNLSHSGDWALIAVVREAFVGVDVERMREGVNIGALLRRIGEKDVPEARDLCYQRWAHREARSKAAGGSLLIPPPENVLASRVEVVPGYAAAVALVGHVPQPKYCYE